MTYLTAPNKMRRTARMASTEQERASNSGGRPDPGSLSTPDDAAPPPAPVAGSNRVPTLVVAGFCFLYLVLAAVIARFPVTDEVFFKAAGRNWAAGGGFAAPELTGALGTIDPPVTEVFFLHPPMYPFLFGLWVRVAGFGPRQCVLFDGLLHVLLVGLTYVLARRCFSPADRPISRPIDRSIAWWAAVAAIAVLPLGTLGRPDELAMSFGLAALFLLLGPGPANAQTALAGVALGFSFGTSVGVAIFSGFIALTILARRAQGLGWLAGRCALAGAGVLVGLAIAVGPLLAVHPKAINQYLEHARLFFNKGSILDTWSEAWPHATKYCTLALGAFTSGLLAAALAGTRDAWRQWSRYGVGALLCLIFFAVYLPARVTYLWFIGPWLILASLHLIRLLAAMPRRRLYALPPLALLVGAHLTFAVHYLKDTLVMATLPKDQGLEAGSRQIRALIPPGAGVLTKEFWWFIADRNRVYDQMFAQPPDGTIDYVVLSGIGSGAPGKPAELDPKIWKAPFTDRMVRVADNLSRSPTRVLGLRVTNSAYGFGAVVYKMSPQTQALRAVPLPSSPTP